MRKSQFTDEQMVEILRETDEHPVADIAKKHKISVPTVYAWKRKFGAMTSDETKRLRSLETENAKLKKLLADKLLELEVLKEIQAKKW